MEKVWAHSENEKGNKHLLAEHLQQTASKAENFANELHIKDITYIASILHDLGKVHPLFQKYINNPDKEKSIDHSSAGAIYASTLKPFGDILAWLIAGHHAGLSDRANLSVRLTNKKEDLKIKEAIKEGLAFLKTENILLPQVPRRFDQRWSHCEKHPEALEVWMRMIFSCLVDADFLDTEAHFKYEERTKIRSTWNISLDELWKKFYKNQMELSSAASPTKVNKARFSIYEACIKAARGETGIYKLSVPTGMGKTLSGMGFALKHAIARQKKRIIVVVPYTSIIDQNSNVYKEIFGQEWVLEHHSSIEPSSNHEHESRRKLAAENWDAPIIITTTVQFFESLFSNKPSSLRKIHNISNSVVILDEFQMLPIELLQPIFSMMKELTQHYGVTFLLSSATPLALDLSLSLTEEKLPAALEVVPESNQLFEDFQRVNYDIGRLDEQWTWEQVAQCMKKSPQAMTIVNTKKQAKRLFSFFVEEEGAFHLSSNMCGQHRKEVLQAIRERLKDGKTVYVVSTQVVEAGVDLDFPLVMRALGPLDRIVQAAGRCNREGKVEKGTMIVFRPEEEQMPPGSYRTATYEAQILLSESGEKLYDPGLYERYFRRLYQSVDTDKQKIEVLRRSKKTPLSFQEVAKRFRMIPHDTISVVCPYNQEAKELLADIRMGHPITREWMRRVQPYVVNILKRSGDKQDIASNLVPLCEGWYEWQGEYQQQTGIQEGMEYEPQYLTV